MPNKTQQLQIRVTPEQKARLKARARRVGLGMSEYVLSQLFPDGTAEFAGLVQALAEPQEGHYALAAVHDWLVQATPTAFAAANRNLDVSALEPLWQNYVAALVEQAATQKAVPVPAWVAQVAPFERPWFAVPYASLRAHLLKASPVSFKRRNLFVDTGLGSRV